MDEMSKTNLVYLFIYFWVHFLCIELIFAFDGESKEINNHQG